MDTIITKRGGIIKLDDISLMELTEIFPLEPKCSFHSRKRNLSRQAKRFKHARSIPEFEGSRWASSISFPGWQVPIESWAERWSDGEIEVAWTFSRRTHLCRFSRSPPNFPGITSGGAIWIFDEENFFLPLLHCTYCGTSDALECWVLEQSTVRKNMSWLLSADILTIMEISP